MSESVKVAVRVRPFNAREKTEGAELCVAMQGNMTKIWDKSSGYEKEFYFDHSYWSHDGFVEDSQTGFLSKSSATSNYADQQAVFDDLGKDVLDNAWNGYHVCLFAYGQTGSGKSYSIVGYGANKGIIPITCDEIFNRIKGDENPLVKYDVKVSMLEIYNEQVQDLLAPPSKRVKGGLKIREHPKTGVFVDGLSKTGVSSYEEINQVLEEGNQHRTVAATQMNATSSRAHTVLTISFTQIFHEEGSGRPLNRKQSDINLVDLAGSERASKTGATGERLAEGSNINKSLSTLGRVITALAEKSSGKGKKGTLVPYRESSLTRILQNALGGNSKTTMIAAISPATYNFEETLSTLRYADQVKSIKNQAIVNETPQEKLIRELREENEKLKALVGSGSSGGSAGMSDEMRREYEAQIEELRKAKEEAEKTFQQRLEEEGTVKRNSTAKQEVKGPHIMNLNEDPMLSGHIKHEFKEGKTSVGRGECEIRIQGLGVGDQHCTVERQGDQHTLVPSPDTNLKLMVNGQIITSPTKIQNQDRIRFGNHLYFLFHDPSVSANPEHDWEFAMKEANENEMRSLLGEKEEEMRRKEEELQRKMQEELQKAQAQMEAERKKMQEMMSARSQDEEALKSREAELQEKQRLMEEQLRQKEEELKNKEKQRAQRARLDNLVSNALQLSNEANERASILGKPIRFKPEFNRGPGKGLDNVKMRMRLMYPGIGDTRLYWGNEKLEERIPDMAEMCQQYFEGTPIEEIDVGYDPFALDPNEVPEMMDEGGYIGQVNLITETLFYLLDVPEEPHPIYDNSGQQIGSLVVRVMPEVEGEDIEEQGYESMNDIVGKNLNLDVGILQAKDLPSYCSKDVYCSYYLPTDGREEFRTSKASGNSPVFNYSQNHRLYVTRLSCTEMEKGNFIISLFGSKPEELKVQEINQVRQALGLSQIPQPAKPQSKLEPEPAKPEPAKPEPAKPEPAKTEPAKTEPAKPEPAKPQQPTNNSEHQKLNSSKPDEEFKSKPSPYSLQVNEESKEKTPTTGVTTSKAPVVEDEKDRKIREMEEKLRQVEVGQPKKSGCCEVF